MGRPRGFDEQETIRSAAALFASSAYDGLSVDDLVTALGVHRNSLYKTFGSKRGLYLAALRWSLEHEVAPVADRISAAVATVGEAGEAGNAGNAGPEIEAAVREAAADPGLDLLILAAAERAPSDAEVARLVADALAGLDRAAGDPDAGGGLVAMILGLRIRARFTAAS